MVNPINNDDAALMLSKFGTKYLAEGEHTDVSASQFVAQAATTLTVLTGGDAAISDNNKDYLASMSLGSVELKAGALIVAPNGELFKSITVATGGALVAYNSVIEGVKPGSFVGLLDTYPDAAAAYSLRKLRTDYSGSTIRVRRTDNTEQDIGFVDNELDTVSLLSFVGSGDGFVVTWYDQSGEGNNITKSTASEQPKIVSSGSVNVKNGKPCVTFNGTSTYLSKGVGNSLDYSGNNIFSFAVNESNVASGRLWADDIIGTQGYIVNQPYDPTPNFIKLNDGGGYADGSSVASTNSIQSLNTLALVGSSGLSINKQNGTSLSSLTVSGWDGTIGTSGTAGFAMGSGANGGGLFNGSIQELVIYTSNKTTDLTAIETNINGFYSIY